MNAKQLETINFIRNTFEQVNSVTRDEQDDKGFMVFYYIYYYRKDSMLEHCLLNKIGSDGSLRKQEFVY